jgi:PEGA domain
VRWVAIAIVLAACGPKPRPNGVTPSDAVVYLHSNLADALVYVDGRFVGPISVIRGGVAVDPGKHRIELRHEDYFSRYVELDLVRAEKKKLQLDLAPVLP